VNDEWDGRWSIVGDPGSGVTTSMTWGLDGSFSTRHWPPLTRRQRWAYRLHLALMQVRPCWRGWGECESCGRRRDGLRRALYLLVRADIR
jgi:hypothetical protein